METKIVSNKEQLGYLLVFIRILAMVVVGLGVVSYGNHLQPGVEIPLFLGGALPLVVAGELICRGAWKDLGSTSLRACMVWGTIVVLVSGLQASIWWGFPGTPANPGSWLVLLSPVSWLVVAFLARRVWSKCVATLLALLLLGVTTYPSHVAWKYDLRRGRNIVVFEPLMHHRKVFRDAEVYLTETLGPAPPYWIFRPDSQYWRSSVFHNPRDLGDLIDDEQLRIRVLEGLTSPDNLLRTHQVVLLCFMFPEVCSFENARAQPKSLEPYREVLGSERSPEIAWEKAERIEEILVELGVPEDDRDLGHLVYFAKPLIIEKLNVAPKSSRTSQEAPGDSEQLTP